MNKGIGLISMLRLFNVMDELGYTYIFMDVIKEVVSTYNYRQCYFEGLKDMEALQ